MTNDNDHFTVLEKISELLLQYSLDNLSPFLGFCQIGDELVEKKAVKISILCKKYLDNNVKRITNRNGGLFVDGITKKIEETIDKFISIFGTVRNNSAFSPIRKTCFICREGFILYLIWPCC